MCVSWDGVRVETFEDGYIAVVDGCNFIKSAGSCHCRSVVVGVRCELCCEVSCSFRWSWVRRVPVIVWQCLLHEVLDFTALKICEAFVDN